MDLYFERHDGSAVTCDDFLAAMADANGQDISRLAAWYGTTLGGIELFFLGMYLYVIKLVKKVHHHMIFQHTYTLVKFCVDHNKPGARFKHISCSLPPTID